MLAILTTHPIQYQAPLWQELQLDGRVPFEVWFISDRGTKPAFDEEFGKTFEWDIDTLDGYRYQFLPGCQKSSPSSFLRGRLSEPLVERLRNKGARALWIQGWQVAAYWQAAIQARAAGVELWLRGESNDLGGNSTWKAPLRNVLVQQLFRRVDRYFYIGSANCRLYRNFGVPSTKLYPAPYAVDNLRFGRQAENLRPHRRELRLKWSIPENAFCILFCGKFIAKKRPMDILHAVKLLNHSSVIIDRPIHLLFVGAGELGNKIRESCNVTFDADCPAGRNTRLGSIKRDTGLPNASFAGFLNQTEISRAYVAADCLVLPSDSRETWGLTVNEALASGLQCIVSNACGCAEDLTQEHSSFNVSDVSMLAMRISNIMRGQHTSVVPPHDFGDC